MNMIHQIILAGTMSVLAVSEVNAQVSAEQTTTHELTVLNQLSSRAAVVNMPVSQLLNAPGNEALRAFFFTQDRKSVV